jgi:aspartate aminotransferase-like enzyme
VSIGSFGERFATIAETYGADVTMMPYEWGQAAVPDEIYNALKDDPAIKAVLVTHNETSTGVTNPLAQIAEVVRSFGDDKLLLVDAVSSLGAIPLEMDAWGLDVVATGSQKGWMVPPGLAFVSMSERAWKANASAKMPRFYLTSQASTRRGPDAVHARCRSSDLDCPGEDGRRYGQRLRSPRQKARWCGRASRRWGWAAGR